MITVNSNTRQFNIPGSDLVFGVTDDSTVERKHFQCPRFVGDNLDLAACFIRINYRNANGKTDFYLVDDLAVNGDNITFSWLLSPRVTEYRGQVKFVMCAVGPDLKLKWHTTQGTGQVMEGLEPDNSHVESQTADVVAQLIAMVEAQTTEVERVGGEQIAEIESATKNATTAAVNEIEAKRGNSLASIPEDYKTLSGTVESLARGKGGAIVCEAAGSAVAIDDASDVAFQSMRVFGRSIQDGTPTPETPMEIKSVESPAVSLYGKNLLQPKYSVGTHTINGLNFTMGKDGSVTLNGTPTASAGFVFETLYIHEPVILTGCPTGGTTRTYRMTADCYKDGVFAETTFDLGDGLVITPSMADYVNINVFAFAGTVFNNLVFYPMVRAASNTDATYEPYKPVQTVATANTLRGIPVTSGGNYTDSDGRQWVCDEIDLGRGVYVQRVGRRVFNGTETIWRRGTFTAGDEISYIYNTDSTIENLALSKCSHGIFAPSGSYWSSGYYMMSGSGRWQILTNMSLDDWSAYLAEQSSNGTPMTLDFPLATPIETSLTEAEIAAYRNLHSNYPNTTVLNDAGAHMVVKYAADTKLYIDNKIKEALQ